LLVSDKILFGNSGLHGLRRVGFNPMGMGILRNRGSHDWRTGGWVKPMEQQLGFVVLGTALGGGVGQVRLKAHFIACRVGANGRTTL
jgi:hypothetical protein